jgi:hypothetical protein
LLTDTSALFFKQSNQIEEAISKKSAEMAKKVANLPTAESTNKENQVEAKTESKISGKLNQRRHHHPDF